MELGESCPGKAGGSRTLTQSLGTALVPPNCIVRLGLRTLAVLTCAVKSCTIWCRDWLGRVDQLVRLGPPPVGVWTLARRQGMIGKGNRSVPVREAVKNHTAVYFTVTGGASALIARAIKEAKVIAYQGLGPGAVRCLEVETLSAIVVNEMYGGSA